jgi:hypothetical protein
MRHWNVSRAINRNPFLEANFASCISRWCPPRRGFLGIGSKVSAPEQKVLDELASAFPD